MSGTPTCARSSYAMCPNSGCCHAPACRRRPPGPPSRCGWSSPSRPAGFGPFAPPGTPAEIVQRLNRELNAIAASPDFVERMARAGAEAAGGSPEQFARIVRDEYESWKAVIQRAGIKAERGRTTPGAGAAPGGIGPPLTPSVQLTTIARFRQQPE